MSEQNLDNNNNTEATEAVEPSVSVQEQQEQEKPQLSSFEALSADTSSFRSYNFLYFPAGTAVKPTLLLNLKSAGFISDEPLFFVENPKATTLSFLQETFGLSNLFQYAIIADRSSRRVKSQTTEEDEEEEESPLPTSSSSTTTTTSSSPFVRRSNEFGAVEATILHVLGKPQTVKSHLQVGVNSNLISVPRLKDCLSHVLSIITSYFGFGINHLLFGSPTRVNCLWSGIQSLSIKDLNPEDVKQLSPVDYLNQYTKFYSKDRKNIRSFVIGWSLIIQRLCKIKTHDHQTQNLGINTKFVNQCWKYFAPSYMLRTLARTLPPTEPAPVAVAADAETGSKRKQKNTTAHVHYVIDDFTLPGQSADSVFRSTERSRAFFESPEVLTLMASADWTSALERAQKARETTSLLKTKFPAVTSDDYFIYDSVTITEMLKKHVSREKSNRTKVQDKMLRAEIGDQQISRKKRKLMFTEMKKKKRSQSSSKSQIAGINAPTPITSEMTQWIEEHSLDRALECYPAFAEDKTRYPRSTMVKMLAQYFTEHAKSELRKSIDLQRIPHLAAILKVPLNENGEYPVISHFTINQYYNNLYVSTSAANGEQSPATEKPKLSRSDRKKQLLPSGKTPKRASLRNSQHMEQQQVKTKTTVQSKRKVVEPETKEETKPKSKPRRRSKNADTVAVDFIAPPQTPVTKQTKRVARAKKHVVV